MLSFGQAPCAGVQRFLAQQLHHELQRCRLIAATQKQQRVAVAHHAFPFLFVQSLDVLNILHDDVQTDVVAAAGGKNFRIAVRLGHICPFVLYDADGDRQSATVLLVGSVVQFLKALGIKHTDEVVHARIIDWYDAEDCPFLLTQGTKVHVITGGHGGILGQVKCRQSDSGTYENAFCGLACGLFEHLVLLHRNMVWLFLLQCFKEHIQRTAVLLIFLAYLGILHHQHHGFKVLFLRWSLAHEIEHQGGVQGNLGFLPEGVIRAGVPRCGVLNQIVDQLQSVLFIP